MKIYAVAESRYECYGHGDYGDELSIRCIGPYGSGPYPPVFRDRKDAENYIKDNPYPQRQVVELELK